MKSAIHIGTSGWSYRHWKNIFYPEGLRTIDWLSFFAQTFNITELNTSFYHLPKIETTKAWAKKVPAGFIFCPKMSRYLTHMKKLNEPEKALKSFLMYSCP